MKKIVCIKCGKRYAFKKEILTCQNHNPFYGYLDVVYPHDAVLEKSSNILDKYKNLLPFKKAQVNFNEQKTPLFKLKSFGEKYQFSKLYVKDESYNPTGSFKDRGALCVINKALEWKIKKVSIASSGNAALSMAAYAQKAGIACECWASSELSYGKKSLITLYGGKIKQKKGNYEKIYRSLINDDDSGWNVTPGINYLHDEGIKLIGFEIFEQIGVPDVIIMPCGNGSLLYSVYKSFKELNHEGLIDKLPKFFGVQIQGASPLKTSFLQKKDFTIDKNTVLSIAEGIIAVESYSSPKVMIALHESKGGIIEVTDKEIIHSLKEIVQLESLVPEPTAASVYAGLKKLPVDKNLKIIAIQTASGFKNLKELINLAKKGI